MTFKSEANKRYGKLFVTETWRNKTMKKHVRYIEWWCKCDCGVEKWIKGCNLRAGRAVSCGCGRAEHPDWGQKVIPKDSKYFFKNWYNIWKRKAIGVNREFTLKFEDLDFLYERQDGKCFYTGVPFILSKSSRNCLYETNISLDRIDNEKGYTLENIVLCLKMVNISRNVYTQDDFISMCRQVANNPTLENYGTKPTDEESS